MPLLYPDYSERDFALASGLGLFITALRRYICTTQYSCAVLCKKVNWLLDPLWVEIEATSQKHANVECHQWIYLHLYDAGTYTQIFFEQELQKYMHIIEEIQCTYKRL